jgi:hypothetical protein
VAVACGLVVKIFWPQPREKPWSFLLLRWLGDLPPKLWITHTSVLYLASRSDRKGIDFPPPEYWALAELTAMFTLHKTVHHEHVQQDMSVQIPVSLKISTLFALLITTL